MLIQQGNKTQTRNDFFFATTESAFPSDSFDIQLLNNRLKKHLLSLPSFSIPDKRLKFDWNNDPVNHRMVNKNSVSAS